jgi:putative hydrolase of the HAD superfamily
VGATSLTQLFRTQKLQVEPQDLNPSTNPLIGRFRSVNKSRLRAHGESGNFLVSPCLTGSSGCLMPDIRAITLDIGGTLIEPWPSVGHVYATVAAEHGVRGLDPEALNGRFREAWRGRGEFQHSRKAWAALVDRVFDGLVDRQPSETFFPRLYDRFGEASAWRIHEDVIPALEELASRGIPLAVVSNWDERLRPLLKRLKLDGYFDAILVSAELYFAKPSNVIFEHALRALGLPAGEVLHVGDSEAEDVQGAREAGMQTRLVARPSGNGPGSIASLRELVALAPDLT